MTLDDDLNHRDRCAIAGIGATEFSSNSGRSALTLATQAITAALDDAGLTIAEVDGLVCNDMDKAHPFSVAAALGARHVAYWGQTGPGGAGPCLMLGLAIGALLSGQARTVVVYRALNGRSQLRLGTGGRRGNGGGETADEFFAPYGLVVAGQVFALAAQRYAIEYGLTPQQLGSVAVTQRANANDTPHAQMRDRRLTMDDYLRSRMIATPLRLYDYCLESDGACAVVVTTTPRARQLRRPAVLIRGVAGGFPPDVRAGAMIFSSAVRDDLTRLPLDQAAQRLWQRTGMGPSDIDVAQIYDCFSISVLMQLESFGFCGRGEAGAFSAEGHTSRRGRIPVNTDGGNMSAGYVHGVNHILEAVRQLRGEATVQVAGAAACLVSSGPLPAGSAAILRKDD